MSSPFKLVSTTSKPVIGPRKFPTTGFTVIPASVKLEEESLPWYKAESFYPISIGDVLCSQYQVLYKIGYGTTSTVWICRDFCHNKYVCMKAMVQGYPSVCRELKAYARLSEEAKATSSSGKKFVRETLDQFNLHHGEYDYSFLIHEPLGLDMDTVLDLCGGRYPLESLRSLSADFLHALEFIHGANVIHADLQPRNILFTIGNENVLKYWEEEEIARPSPRKFKGEWTVFAKKQFKGLLTDWLSETSTPVLCDFGEARFGKDCSREVIQPAEYRAPEVFLRVAWGAPVDIWSLGCMMWHIATARQLFPRSEDQDEPSADGVQLATMAVLLGRPPRKLLDKSGQHALQFFNQDGSSRYNVPHQTLESRFASAFEGNETPPTARESKAFIEFIRRVLVWDDKKRPSASQLLMDPWVDS